MPLSLRDRVVLAGLMCCGFGLKWRVRDTPDPSAPQTPLGKSVVGWISYEMSRSEHF